MSLHSGIDTVAVVSHGAYTETFGSGDPANIANLFASFGLLEDAPGPSAISVLPDINLGRPTLLLSDSTIKI